MSTSPADQVLTIHPSALRGSVAIPGSKSHTIRAIAIAALAKGESVITNPLESHDAQSALDTYTALGATVVKEPDAWRIAGTGARLSAPDHPIDVGNSGTTLNIALGSAALIRKGKVIFTGDAQIQRRPSGPLAASLNDLGAHITSLKQNGCAPFEVRGTLRGGETTIEAVTSQYVTSLLMAAPLAERDTAIHVPLMHEKPYVTITLDWLARQGVTVEYDEDYTEFRVRGGQVYHPVNRPIPADFSSGTFFLAAGALADNDVMCSGLDLNDTQGDKAVVEYLREMGAEVTAENTGIRVQGRGLRGCDLDLNATPDALPMMAALACYADGTTRLLNVPQARLKETDRIAVMKKELEKLGGSIEELDDGLVIHHSPLRGGEVDSHGDHRVVMALAIAATQASGTTTIHGSHAAAITYPAFARDLESLRAP